MAVRSGEEIQRALTSLVTRWTSYRGTERAEAQTFLNELVACYGSDRREIGAVFEDSHVSAGIVDMHLPGVCIVEMKAPREAERLVNHRRQALDYWQHSDDAATGRPAPPYVVLCAFQAFEVWEPGRFPSAPRDSFTLEELPDRYESLLFLAGGDNPPFFHAHRRALTTEATSHVISLYHALLDRDAAAPETIRRFLLQIVWCLFAENLGMLQGQPVQRIITDLLAHPDRSSYAELGSLFTVLDEREDYGRHGVLAGTTYVNGELFSNPARVHLEPDELGILQDATHFEWRDVDPTIFGSLMEGALGRDRRWELGAHYTHEVDIMKIVRPSIVEPWARRIDNTSTPEEALRVLGDLCRFAVLDPACGCGNFLYVAYRELRGLEAVLKARIADLRRTQGAARPSNETLPSYPIRNLYGIDTEPIAVLIARVTLWMGHKQVSDRFGPAEPVLPLVDLSGIRRADALQVAWPAADVIIGNPPFHGGKHLRPTFGDEYVNWLRSEFGCGVKDYCVYWFRKTHDALAPNGRAGLVGTNSITQTKTREASLEYIVARGGVITSAISTQDWPGDAAVDVSIVNWIKSPTAMPSAVSLDGVTVRAITAELRTPERSTLGAKQLAMNRNRAFAGVVPQAKGFILEPAEATDLLADPGASYERVVRPFLTGDDIADDPMQHPRRWIIDFFGMSLEEAMRYPRALDIVRTRVKPARESSANRNPEGRWWLFGRNVEGMRNAVRPLDRFVVATATGKRLLSAWAASGVLANNATYVFAFDDDYTFGVLSSRIHELWARARSSTLEDRLRYTTSAVFETWPFPARASTEDIAALGAELTRERQRVCAEETIGLTEVYNRLDDGAYATLAEIHKRLDLAVLSAYGWDDLAVDDDDEIVRRLLQRNVDVHAGVINYNPFGDSPLTLDGT